MYLGLVLSILYAIGFLGATLAILRLDSIRPWRAAVVIILWPIVAALVLTHIAIRYFGRERDS